MSSAAHATVVTVRAHANTTTTTKLTGSARVVSLPLILGFILLVGVVVIVGRFVLEGSAKGGRSSGQEAPIEH